MAHAQALADHLAWWGLRRFTSDAAYFQWQREALSQHLLTELNRLVNAKQATGSEADEVAFYNFSTRPEILPVLYSQGYDYYLAVGPAVVERLAGAHSILDFGCGPGILTSFYARRFPDRAFTGIDRSQACIDAAAERALALGLPNVRYQCLDVGETSIPGRYDLVVASHALLQTENDPGLPSVSWRTFERGRDPHVQQAFEQRTGLKSRLDRLRAALAPEGRVILVEKTAHLARRIPFQRALAAQALRVLATPLPIPYTLVEEVVDDGPLYVLGSVAMGRPAAPGFDWEEGPVIAPSAELYQCLGKGARELWERLPGRVPAEQAEWSDSRYGGVRLEWGSAAGILAYLYVSMGEGFQGAMVGGPNTKTILQSRFVDIGRLYDSDSREVEAFLEATWSQPVGQEEPHLTPLYENHTCAAQAVWAGLPQPRVMAELTKQEDDGRQVHIEWGESAGLIYLYCANTFDQRQLVLMDPERRTLLEDYYRELTGEHASQPGEPR